MPGIVLVETTESFNGNPVKPDGSSLPENSPPRHTRPDETLGWHAVDFDANCCQLVGPL